jgi:photosystem II stability/assembly factor-like uncharacterized protein
MRKPSFPLSSSLLFVVVLAAICAAPLGALPLTFEQNRGQADAEVRFLARGSGYVLFLTRSSAVMKLGAAATDAPEEVISMKLRGASDVAPQGERRASTRTSYFLGSDPRQWRQDVPAYEKVRYPRVYRGIDLVYYGAEGAVEYGFEVSAGSDPGVIRLAFEGARSISVSREGDLVISTASGDVRQQRPFAYQLVNGEKRAVRADYVLRNRTEVGFRVGRYNRSLPLVIDPVVRFASYLGGNGNDTALAVATDAAGNSYIAGCTQSINFPGAPRAPRGGRDVFVTKLNRNGSAIVYTAFVGGAGAECAGGIAVAADGSAHITGYTESSDFPIRNAAQPQFGGALDAFVTTLDPTGANLYYSTFLGGSAFENNPQVGPIGSIAIGADGLTYVTGHTLSNDFPVTEGAAQRTSGGDIDAFVARIKTAPSVATTLQYASYLGGGSYDVGSGIAVDENRSAYVTGATRSSDFPVTARAFQKQYGGGSDAFITKLAAPVIASVAAPGDGFAYSSYVGGESYDSGESVIVDRRGQAHLAAYSDSIDYPTVRPLQTAHGGYFQSTNRGATWTKKNSGLQTSLIRAFAVDARRPGRIYAATLRGVYRSLDSGQTWQEANAGLPLNPARELDVLDVALDAEGVQLFAATRRGLFRSVDGGESWERRDAGLPDAGGSTDPSIVTVAIDPKTPTTVYAAVTAPAGGLVFKSVDAGRSWTAIDQSVTRGRITLFGRALVIDPQKPSTLYAGTFGSIYRSDDGGTTWTELQGGLPGSSVRAIAIHPTNTSILYAATITDVFKSTDRGATWRRSSAGVGDGIVTGLAMDPDDPSTLYLNKAGNSIARIAGAASTEVAATRIVNGGVFKTTDGGQQWFAVNEGLESNGGGGIAVQPGNSAIVHAGAQVVGDVVLTVFSADGASASVSTYFGGRDRDRPAQIAFGCGERVFVGGSTMSDDYPLLAPTQNARNGHLYPDAFVTEFSLTDGAAMKFSTFAGSPDEEEDTRGLAADCEGNVYLTGMTYSRVFPVVAPLQYFHGGGLVDGFVLKIDVDAARERRRRTVRH